MQTPANIPLSNLSSFRLSRFWLPIPAIAVLLGFSGCGGSDSGASGVSPPTQAIATACEDLTKLTFEGDTTISSATQVTGGQVTAGGTTMTGLPSFCRVVGVSKPTTDSQINFEVWLPFAGTWNGRFMSVGEGGFAGSLAYSFGNTPGFLSTAVKDGYATVSSDTGHVATDPNWAIGHPEKVTDYLYRAKHLVVVAAKGLVSAYYAKDKFYSYHNQCSNSGRQGLMEVQRYPEDFDGVVAGAPWNYQSGSNAQSVWAAQALAVPGAFISQAKLPAITAAAVVACDGNDGLSDSVITDPRTCNFNPDALLCTGPETDSCLTAPQLTALKKIYSGPANPRTGAKISAGYEYGSEVNMNTTLPSAQGPGMLSLATTYFGKLVYEDPAWDYTKFDFDTDFTFAKTKIGVIGDALSTDYTASNARNVKIIQYHGWADTTIPPRHSTEYYDSVAQANGGYAATQQFYRLFMVPGMSHCFGGTGAASFGNAAAPYPPVRDEQHDAQRALEAWVERGVPPQQLVASRYSSDLSTVQFTRKLCMHPQVAKYDGSGDPTSATSFTCVNP